MIDRYSLFYILPFSIGIMLTNLIGKDVLTACGALAVWSAFAYNIPAGGSEAFFWHILFVRIQAAVWLYLWSRVLSPKAVMRIAIGIWSFFGGCFLTMAVMERSAYGIVLFAAAIIPQWLCYLAAITLSGKGKHYPAYVCAIGFLLLGCVIEGFISPNILKKIF